MHRVFNGNPTCQRQTTMGAYLTWQPTLEQYLKGIIIHFFMLQTSKLGQSILAIYLASVSPTLITSNLFRQVYEIYLVWRHHTGIGLSPSNHEHPWACSWKEKVGLGKRLTNCYILTTLWGNERMSFKNYSPIGKIRTHCQIVSLHIYYHCSQLLQLLFILRYQFYNP